jgi:hypothetical protein
VLRIFKDAIRTPRQRASYYWAKRLVAVISGFAVARYVNPIIGDWSIAIGLLSFFIAYITIAPIIAALLCLIEALLRNVHEIKSPMRYWSACRGELIRPYRCISYFMHVPKHCKWQIKKTNQNST